MVIFVDYTVKIVAYKITKNVNKLHFINIKNYRFINSISNSVTIFSRFRCTIKNTIFKHYCLVATKNTWLVVNNMAFGLKQAKTPPDEIDRRVREAAQILEITDLIDRTPRALSGGQRQRVAIGRAIVREPDVFLFDEPLSNLDAALRVQTRVEIARLHKRLGTTMIYVTHDQVEAMTLADKIVVLRGGVIEQIGSPIKLYEESANMFVAQFIGSPKMNFFNKDDLTAAGGKLLDDSADCL